MIIQSTARNFVKPTAKETAKFLREIDQYYDKRRYLTKVKRKGRYIWGMKMFKRARQIQYFKRMRALKKAYN